MQLSALVAAYMAALPAGIVLDQQQVERNLKAAVRKYCGYATLTNHLPDDPDTDVHSPVDATNSIAGGQNFDLTPSELAVIEPLFRLYAEMENATSLEASRALGLDVYGRNSSEIAQDIKEKEMDLPRLCFWEPVETI